MESQSLPQDTVSTIVMGDPKLGNQNLFLTGDWSGHIRVYQILDDRITLLNVFEADSPIFSLGWLHIEGQLNSELIFSTGDGLISKINLEIGEIKKIGEHQGIINVEIQRFDAKNTYFLYSLGEDDFLNIWKYDGKEEALKLVKNFMIGDKCCDLTVNDDLLVICTTNGLLIYCEIEKLFEDERDPFKRTNSKIEAKVTCIKIQNLQNPILAVGSIDGRISMLGYNSEEKVFESKIIFKAHKGNKLPGNHLFMVNDFCLSHKDPNFFGTAGSDGLAQVWNITKRNRSSLYEYKDQNVSAINVTPDGKYIVYATGYDWFGGVSQLSKYKSRVQIYCHRLSTNEIKLVN